jgi:regulatory protein YycI of two-component signal transduction system YycFG
VTRNSLFCVILLILNVFLLILFGIYREKVNIRDKRITNLERKVEECISVSNILLSRQTALSNYDIREYDTKKFNNEILLLPKNKEIDDFYGFYVKVSDTKEEIIEFGLHKP